VRRRQREGTLGRNKHEAAESVISEIQRRWGEQAAYKAPKPTPVTTIPTGYGTLDSLISGIPRGRITEFTGDLSSGLTTLSLRLAASAQSKGDPVIYIDLRYSFDPYHAKKCGVSTERLFLVRPAFVVSGLDIAYQIVTENAAGLIVINSTATILKAAGGSQMLDTSLRKLAPALRRTNCAVVFLTPHPTKSAAIAHYASLQLGFERQLWVERREKILGYETQVTVLRNRAGPTGKSATIYIGLDGSHEAVRQEAA
jgi:RecA/RadA recombinase